MFAFQGQLNNYKINRLSLIVQVNKVLNVVDSDWRFDDLSAAFRHVNNLVVKSAILLMCQQSHLLSVHRNVQ